MQRKAIVPVLALVWTGCSSQPAAPGPDANETVIEASPNAPFQLRIGQTAMLEDQLMIAFRRVSGDSRCPSDVQCVWSGDATVHLDITIARMAWTPRDLHTHVDPRATVFRDYHIEVSDLLPYPVSTRSITPGEYVVTLEVTRKP